MNLMTLGHDNCDSSERSLAGLEAESATRVQAVRYAKASMAMESLFLDPEAELMFARYERGEIDWHDLSDFALAE